jgi:aspartyl-tRNA(Asn)/glutamyl-tRNA(Gln) amidotransferase subunit A
MGGSIRLPAGFCGVVGVKGTYGRIPRGPGWIGKADMIHYGPLARTVGDCARFRDVAAGVDSRDPGSLPAPAVPFEQAIEQLDLAGLRVTVIDDNGLTPSEPSVRAALRATADVLIAAADLREVPGRLEVPDLLPGAAAMLFADGDPAMAELMPGIMANLMVTDGAAPLMEMAFATADLSLEAVNRQVQVRHALTQEMARAFDEADLLLLPTSPVPAYGCGGPLPTLIDGREVGPQAAALMTGPFNMSGHPVVSVPMGMADGAPVGMQIVARRHDDALALAAALAVERAQPWPLIAPDPA